MEGVAEVSVVQDYVNREEKAIEVIYYFPIEEGAAVTKVEAEVEGRKVVGKVKEKEKARQEYQQATSRGHTAVMVEEVKADILEMKVGRLAAGAGCRVNLTSIVEFDAEPLFQINMLATTSCFPLRRNNHLAVKQSKFHFII